MAETFLQGTVDGRNIDIFAAMSMGRRGVGQPRTQWQDNIVEWTGLEMGKALRVANDRIG